jgi:sugar lactone lactonase YvrE
MISIARLVGLVALAPSLLVGQSDPVVESRAQYRQAVQAYEAGDYPAFLEHARVAQQLRPSHGGVSYALASAYALNGDTASALASLKRFAALGYFADPATDSAFASLRGTGGLAEVERQLARNREPIVKSTVAFTLPQKDLLTEGVAYDPRDAVFYVGSVHRRKIVRMTADGRFSDFVTFGGDAPWAPLGMRVDATRRLLWVAVAALPQSEGFTPADSNRSALVRIDLETGKVTGEFEIPRDGRPHTLGDVALTRAGDVYGSDSRAPAIYRVRDGRDSLELFLESPLLLAAQGLVFTPDERRLYVADYSRGIVVVDVAARRVELMPTADTVLALGIDGLYYREGALIGIQNGVDPHRVVRLELSRDGARIVRSVAVERAHPRYIEPTLGVLVDRDLYYVANSQWEQFGEDGRVANPDSLQRPVVLRLRL